MLENFQKSYKNKLEKEITLAYATLTDGTALQSCL